MKDQIFTDPTSKEKKQAQFGKWHVSKDGTMDFCGDSVMQGALQIHFSEFRDSPDGHWILHLMARGYDLNEFIPAMIQAHRNLGLKEIKFQSYY